jgi:carboxypeptidase family protein
MGINLSTRRNRLLVLVVGVALALMSPVGVRAQTLSTGAITGLVTDPSGAAVPNATVTASSTETGVVRTVTSGSNGSYTVAQLNPGRYKVSVKATGFRTQEQGPVAVVVSQTINLDFALELGKATEIVEVTAQGTLIQTSNPNTTTTLNAQSIANLPNPGNDLTFEAQIAPGAVMNSTGGYGNVEFNGLPSVSNNFTIDGLDANDPFLNLNNSGATNLQLGLSAIEEVVVNTTSYSVDQGRLGSAQINYTTKSGTNSFHGSAFEIWNGSRLNSADFFTNAAGNKKPRSNVNQFAGSLGGPIRRDKLFFFADLEGTRIVVPVVENNITYPTAAYQTYVLSQLPVGGFDSVFGRPLPAQPGEVSFYNNMFTLYGQHSGTPVPTIGCPFDVGGVANAADDGNGCAIHRTFSLSNHALETLFTVKVDQNIGDKNTVWYRFQMDNGTQPTYTDPINPIFNAISVQPERNANVGWTHTFGPNLVNQFNPGFSWYTAIFKPLSLAKSLAAFPIVYSAGPFTELGGINFVWPQGRDVTQWQLNDNMSWTKGKHDLKVGENLRRVLVSDHDFGFFNTPLVLGFDLPAFTFGEADLTIQSFPRTLSEPIGIVNLDTFVLDTFKATSKLTLVYGVRATWNADPKNQQGLYSRPPGSFYSINHSVTRPPNQDLLATSFLFPSTPLIFWQPRGSIAYAFRPNTVYRAGFGVFSDIFPASLADSMATNPPFDPQFNGGAFGSIPGGVGIAPGLGAANSAIDAAVAANQAFQTSFAGGVVSCAAPGAPANCIPAAGISAVPSGQYQYPYFMQWSSGIEQQLTPNWGLKVQYVGTRQVHVPYTVQANGYQTVCAGCFAPWPFGAPPDPRFGSVSQYIAGAGSFYHGLQFNGTKRMSHGLQFALNYTYSHCTDEISNGGIFGFGGPNILSPLPGELRRDHGNCDYDVRHALNGNYIYQLPFHSSSGRLNHFIGGWQISGTVFARGGFPLSVASAGYTAGGAGIFQGGGPNFANAVPGVSPYSKLKNIPGITQPGQVQWLNPAAFASVVDSSTGSCTAGETIVAGAVTATNDNPATCQFGTLGRNTLRAPSFRWSDLFVTKRFKLTERVSLRIDGQFYNFLNHPNFAFPGTGVGVPSVPSTLTGLGTISSEITPPTGLLGSFLGGDNAVRMIALSGRIEF